MNQCTPGTICDASGESPVCSRLKNLDEACGNKDVCYSGNCADGKCAPGTLCESDDAVVGGGGEPFPGEGGEESSGTPEGGEEPPGESEGEPA